MIIITSLAFDYNPITIKMFFGAEIQISIKLTKFRNLHIKQPCLLQVCLSIHHYNSNKQPTSSIPISILPLTYQTSHDSKSQFNHFDNTYLTDKIPIRFQDCVISLNEICLFKTTVDATQFNYKNKCFVLRAELMLLEEQTLTPLIKVEAQTKSLFEYGYLSMMFDNTQCKYTSCLEIELQSQLLGFKFYDNTGAIKRMSQKQNINKGENEMQPILEFRQFKDFLLYATDKYKKEKIQTFYDKYVGQLRKQINYLKTHIKTYIQFLDKTNNHSLDINIIRKLSEPLPEPAYLSKRHKLKTFHSSIQLSSMKNIQGTEKKKEESISESNLSPELLEQSILKDINVLSKILYDLWREDVKLNSQYSNPLYSSNLKQKYLIEAKRHYISSNCVIQGYKQNNYPISFECSSRTKNKYFASPNLLNLSKLVKKSNKKHLIVLVHGFQACSLDLQNIQNLILHMFPHCQLLMSSNNQNRTQKSIEVLGQRLALEIKNHINSQPNKQNYKISFIAHSLGGIIIRSALEYLMYYKDSFGTYISLSSPHLGYLFHTSTLIKTSLWVLNKMNKCQSLMELTFQDINDLESSYMFKLSSKPGLQFFEAIIFQSSRFDEYVPYSSARVEMCDQARDYPENPNSIVYKKMIRNLLGKVNEERVVRINVQFANLENDFNTMIGRTAHIQLLSDPLAMKALLVMISDVFS